MSTYPEIEKNVTDHDVVLFMKGVPGNSSCSYSTRLVQILENLNVTFTNYDVLASRALRDAVKAYTGVKTLPQLFIKGSFIGGSDDIRDYYENGGIVELFESRGVSINPSPTRIAFKEVTKEDIKRCGEASVASQVFSPVV